jgi:hypothetical protein
MQNSYLQTVISNLLLTEISSQQIRAKKETLRNDILKSIEKIKILQDEESKAERAREKKEKVAERHKEEKSRDSLLDKLHDVDHEMFDQIAKENGLGTWEKWETEKSKVSYKPKKEESFIGPPREKKIVSTEGEWVAWSPPAAALYNPDKAKSKLKSLYKKSGPGEYSVAEEFGDVEVMGSGYDFDILQRYGGVTKWEVKEVDRGRLRTSVHGIVASAEPRHELNVAMKKIQKTVNELVKDNDTVSASLSPKGINSLRMLTTFVEKNMESIFSKSEITSTLIEKLMTALENARIIRNELNAYAGMSPNMISIGGADPIKVSNTQFQKIVRILGDPTSNISQTSSTNLQDRAADYVNELEDVSIDNPDSFIDQMEQKMSPENSFGSVNGVILVTSTHYCVVPKEKLGEILDFDGLTQGGRAFYSLKSNKAGNSGAEKSKNKRNK